MSVRWLPFPLLSASILVTWLLLNKSVSPGQILLGVTLAVGGGWLLGQLQPANTWIRNPMAIIRLGFLVLIDIVRSNIAVAQIILSLRHKKITSGFLSIPLDMKNRYGLAILACIITATPGTLWVKYNPHTGLLTMHVLDLVDEAAWVDTIKGRYESLLMEIFE